MIFGLVKKIRLLLMRRPRKGDVYEGDAFDFLAGNYIEPILHGMRDKYGNISAVRADGPGSYKFLVSSTAMPYYILHCSILVIDCKTSKFEWKTRCQPRRVKKETFHEMILDGRLKLYDPDIRK